jgi:hypothetical protein
MSKRKNKIAPSYWTGTDAAWEENERWKDENHKREMRRMEAIIAGTYTENPFDKSDFEILEIAGKLGL